MLNYETFREQAKVDYTKHINAFLSNEANGEEIPYGTLDYNNDDHRSTLIESMDNVELTAVVDEEAGGIIAYAIGGDNAELIAQALWFYRDAMDKKKNITFSV